MKKSVKLFRLVNINPCTGIKRCFGLAATGDKDTIPFKVYLMRQKEAASFDSFTALIRLHQN